jgi:hypothetical protein
MYDLSVQGGEALEEDDPGSDSNPEHMPSGKHLPHDYALIASGHNQAPESGAHGGRLRLTRTPSAYRADAFGLP